MEVCICAAVKYKDKIWFGHRHRNALDAMNDELSYSMNREQLSHIYKDVIQGFITTKNRFVDREEGCHLQFNAGIKSVCKKNPYFNGELYSEDLY
jgi:hypothetical protein